jgi:hypothetical protein
MLDTPHISPADQVAPKLMTVVPTPSEDGLAWQFPASFYPNTRFVLWGETLRLDVTTFTALDKDNKVTMLWRGTCAKLPKQLP